MVLNKSLQVGILMVCVAKLNAELIKTTGDQRAKYECRACGTDVQELPVECAVPSRGYVSLLPLPLSGWLLEWD